MKIFSVISFIFISLSCFCAERWISLVPFWEEVFDYYEVNESLVGVSSFCPSDLTICKNKIELGSSLTPLKEKIFLTRPTKIWTGPYRDLEFDQFCHKNNFSLVSVNHDRLEDIKQAMKKIGQMTGKMTTYEKWRREIDSHRGTVKALPPQLLLVVGIQFSGSDIIELTIANKNTYFYDLLNVLLNKNEASIKDKKLAYFQLSMEKLLILNTSSIIFFLPDLKSSERLVIEQKLKNVKKLILAESYSTIPGPRVVKMLPSIVGFLNGQ